MSTFTHTKMELLAEQSAEHSDFETESDGETEKEERMYDETLLYLIHGRYSEGAAKQDKGVIWKRQSKHYRTKRATSHHLPSHQLQSQRTLLLRST